MDGSQVWPAFRVEKLPRSAILRNRCAEHVSVVLRFQKLRGHLNEASYSAEIQMAREFLAAHQEAVHWRDFASAWKEAVGLVRGAHPTRPHYFRRVRTAHYAVKLYIQRASQAVFASIAASVLTFKRHAGFNSVIAHNSLALPFRNSSTARANCGCLTNARSGNAPARTRARVLCSPCAAFDGAEPMFDGVFDGLVVTGLEVRPECSSFAPQ